MESRQTKPENLQSLMQLVPMDYSDTEPLAEIMQTDRQRDVTDSWYLEFTISCKII